MLTPFSVTSPRGFGEGRTRGRARGARHAHRPTRSETRATIGTTRAHRRTVHAPDGLPSPATSTVSPLIADGQAAALAEPQPTERPSGSPLWVSPPANSRAHIYKERATRHYWHQPRSP